MQFRSGKTIVVEHSDITLFRHLFRKVVIHRNINI